MAATPENEVKKLVRALLQEYGEDVWSHWPVPYGYGESTLDCLAAARTGPKTALAFAVETKKPRATPTRRQNTKIGVMMRAGMRVFVIDGRSGVEDLRNWLDSVTVRSD